MVVSLNRYRVSAGRVCCIVVDGYARALFIYIGLCGKFFFLAVTICFLKFHFGFSFSNSIWIGAVNFVGYFGFVCLDYQLVPPSIWRH